MRIFSACLLFVFGAGLVAAAAQDSAPSEAGMLWRFEARYRLELIEVKARDETGAD